MTDDTAPITQRDGAVVIRGAPMLAAAYRALLAGIARRRRDRLPAYDLQQLAQALHRACMSSPRHEIAHSTPNESCWAGQDDDWVGTAEASELLHLSSARRRGSPADLMASESARSVGAVPPRRVSRAG